MGIVLILLPLIANLAVARLFFITLKRGNTPLITAFARVEQGGGLSPELVTYTRRLTGIWGVFLLLLGMSHLLPFRSAAVHPGHAMQFLFDPALIACFFLIEFAWRVRRFPAHRFVPPWELWALIRRQGGLFHLYRQCLH
ncbi:MAG: hypothetical protein ACKVQQ_02810 [Burkholderiales bacterium]